MASKSLASLLFVLGADIKDFQTKMRQAQNSVRKTGEQFKKIGKNMSMYVTAPILAMAGFGIKSASEIETMRVGFESLLGDVKKAGDTIKKLINFAATTPFQLQGIGAASRQLLAAGVETTQLKEKLKFLGDVAAGANVPLSDMASIFVKVKNKGKMMTEELLQLSDRGIPIIKVLADQMGVAKESVFEMASESQISFKMLEDSLISMTKKGGIYEDQMVKQSGTIAGIWSTLKDNLSLALAEIGENIINTFDLKGLMEKVIQHLRSFVEWFKELSPPIRKTILIIGALVAALGPLLVILGVLMTSVIPGVIAAFVILKAVIIANPIGALITVLGLAAGALLLFTGRSDDAADAQWRLGDAIKGVTKELGKQIWETFAAGFDITRYAYSDFSRGIDNLRENLTKLTSGELRSLKLYLEDQVAEATRKAANATDDYDGAIKIIDDDLENYKEALDLVNGELEKYEAAINRIGSKPIKQPDLKPISSKDLVPGEFKIPDTEPITIEFRSVNFEGVAGELALMQEALKQVDYQNEIFGNRFDEVAAQMQIYQNAICNLLDEGLKPMDPIIQALKDKFDELDKIQRAHNESISLAVSLYTELAGKGIKSAEELANAVCRHAKRMIGAEIASGVASAVASALRDIPYPFNVLLAGAAGAAAALLFDNLVPNFVKGGIVPPGFPNDTYLANLTSGEMVLPAPIPLSSVPSNQNIHITGHLVGQGDQLIAVIQNATNKRYRVRGY